MTFAHVVETSVTVTDNSPFQDYPHPDDHTTRSTVTPGFKPFTVLQLHYMKYFTSHRVSERGPSGLSLYSFHLHSRVKMGIPGVSLIRICRVVFVGTN